MDHLLEVGADVLLAQDHLDAGMLALEVGEEVGQEPSSGAGQHPDRQAAAAQAADLLHPRPGLLDLQHDLLRMGQQRLAGVGQGQLPA